MTTDWYYDRNFESTQPLKHPCSINTRDFGYDTVNGAGGPTVCPEGLRQRYRDLLNNRKIHRADDLKFNQLLGEGGQGVVYLSECRGSDGFALPVALKFFSPEIYPSEEIYSAVMGRFARTASRVAQIQHDNLLDVRDWMELDGIRIMEMEWVDGYDLVTLLCNNMLKWLREHVSGERLRILSEVVVTDGPVHPRLKPGIAFNIVRACLSALGALHRNGIVHGDIKLSNIMLKRTGSLKIVDIGSAYVLEEGPPERRCTPEYAPPEMLRASKDDAFATPRSDLASLGYVLVELLSGSPLFRGKCTFLEMIEKKESILRLLPQILPEDVVRSDIAMEICRRLVDPDPAGRYPSAEDAVNGMKENPFCVAALQRQLVNAGLSSEYDHDIRAWLADLECWPRGNLSAK